jgi:ATP/maltotriose-dependent transcriptional regulator MalT
MFRQRAHGDAVSTTRLHIAARDPLTRSPNTPSGSACLELLDRGRLIAALDPAVARKVTVVSAPAGSGKTSLLRARGRSVRGNGVAAPLSRCDATSFNRQLFTNGL